MVLIDWLIDCTFVMSDLTIYILYWLLSGIKNLYTIQCKTLFTLDAFQFTGNEWIVSVWQGRSKSLSEFFYTARNAMSMYFDGEPSTADVEVRSWTCPVTQPFQDFSYKTLRATTIFYQTDIYVKMLLKCNGQLDMSKSKISLVHILLKKWQPQK